jgi:hypothetical protein
MRRVHDVCTGSAFCLRRCLGITSVQPASSERLGLPRHLRPAPHRLRADRCRVREARTSSSAPESRPALCARAYPTPIAGSLLVGTPGHRIHGAGSLPVCTRVFVCHVCTKNAKCDDLASNRSGYDSRKTGQADALTLNLPVGPIPYRIDLR